MLTKSQLRDKYLNPKKKRKRTRKVKKAKSKVIDMQDQDYLADLEKGLDEETFLEDEKPVFVETEESQKLSVKEKEAALEKIYGKTIKKSKREGKKTGKWVSLQESSKMEEEKIVEEESSEEQEVDSSSSEEEGLGVRHDSSDSEDEEDENEVKMEKEERAKMFKDDINRALGLGKGVDIDTESEDDDDSDLDSGSSEEKDALAEKLEELKAKDKVLKELAKEFKNAATIFRDQEGKKMKIEDFEAAKKKKLEQLNRAMVSQSDFEIFVQYKLPNPLPSSNTGKEVTSSSKTRRSRSSY